MVRFFALSVSVSENLLSKTINMLFFSRREKMADTVDTTGYRFCNFAPVMIFSAPIALQRNMNPFNRAVR